MTIPVTSTTTVQLRIDVITTPGDSQPESVALSGARGCWPLRAAYPVIVSTLVVGEEPVVTQWLAERRALGHDHRDEVWEGVYHVVPHASVGHARVAAQVLRQLGPLADERGLVDIGEFNLGEPGDFRVPDGGWLAADAPFTLYAPTAVAVLEVLSPGDETFTKFGFYAARGVQEVLVADPEARTVTCHIRSVPGAGAGADAPGWAAAGASEVFGCTMAWLAQQVRWPAPAA